MKQSESRQGVNVQRKLEMSWDRGGSGRDFSPTKASTRNERFATGHGHGEFFLMLILRISNWWQLFFSPRVSINPMQLERYIYLFFFT